MADHLALSVEGVDDFIAACRNMERDARREVESHLRASKDAVVARFRQVTPIAPDAHHGHPPGNLRKGIRATVDVLTMHIRSSAPHAHLVEYGTQRWAGKPFFIAHAMAERAEFRRKVTEIMKRPRPDIGPGTPDVVEVGE